MIHKSILKKKQQLKLEEWTQSADLRQVCLGEIEAVVDLLRPHQLVKRSEESTVYNSGIKQSSH